MRYADDNDYINFVNHNGIQHNDYFIKRLNVTSQLIDHPTKLRN